MFINCQPAYQSYHLVMRTGWKESDETETIAKTNCLVILNSLPFQFLIAYLVLITLFSIYRTLDSWLCFDTILGILSYLKP